PAGTLSTKVAFCTSRKRGIRCPFTSFPRTRESSLSRLAGIEEEKFDPRFGEDDAGASAALTAFLKLASSLAFFSAAICCIVRPVLIDVRYLSVRPVGLPAWASSSLRRSQFSVRSLPRGLRRNRIQSPFILWPSSVKCKWPCSSVLRGSLPGAGIQRPQSQSITVPPPYSPFGIVPSKLA